MTLGVQRDCKGGCGRQTDRGWCSRACFIAEDGPPADDDRNEER